MRNTIRFKSWGSVINGSFIVHPFGYVELGLDFPRPSPSLQMHIFIPFSFVPPFSLLIFFVLLPSLGELRAVRRLRD
uniref:Uncharacterized protein n=1 Tax=Cannabis sativa TaxID=3483 RepID=A0A803RAQ7_CANSA